MCPKVTRRVTGDPHESRSELYLCKKRKYMNMNELTKEETISKAIRLNNYWIIDRRKNSNSMEVNAAVGGLMNDMKLRDEIPKGGEYLDRLINHVKVIILNLYYVYTADPDRYVAYSKRSGGYTKTKGYKGFQFSHRNIIRVTDILRKNGYIEDVKGYPASEEYTQAQLSKMRATEKLVSILEVENKITPDMVEVDNSHEEIIVVKGLKPKPTLVQVVEDGKKKRKKKQRPRKACKTPDTRAVKQMRINLKYINAIMEQASITLDITQQELRELNARLNQDDDPHRQAVDFSRTSLHRVFLDRDFKKGGRFYGPWYQNIYKEYRPRIMINNVPTIEVDYSGYHPRILYGLKGLSLPEDPYTLDDYPDSDEMRKFLKIFFLTMINSETPEEALGGIRGQHRKEIRKNMKTGKGRLGLKPPEVESLHNHVLQPIMDKLREKHEPIADDYIFSGYGNTLQWTDSHIAEYVMGHFALQGHPCLPVHDSFIVDFRLEDELKEIMERVFVHNFQHDIPVKDNRLQLFLDWGLDRVEDDIFRRIYEGLSDGTIDKERLEKGFVKATRILREGIKKLNTNRHEPQRK